MKKKTFVNSSRGNPLSILGLTPELSISVCRSMIAELVKKETFSLSFSFFLSLSSIKSTRDVLNSITLSIVVEFSKTGRERERVEKKKKKKKKLF